MRDYMKNVIIGIFVVSALAIVTFILLYLHPSTGDEGQVLFARFTDIDKVNVGTLVTFAGKKVGEVAAILELQDGREGPKDDYGHVYVYELKLLIDSHVEVYDTDQISLRTSGLLGERSVSIMPMAPPEGVIPKKLNDKDIIYATQIGSVEDAVKEFKEVADNFDRALKNVSEILEDARKEELVKHVTTVFHNLGDITTALNRPNEWTAILKNIDKFTGEFATRLPKSWDTLDFTLSDARTAAGNAKVVFADVSSGQGSLGRLLVKDDLYLGLKSVMNKAETVMDDINHYGVMFHNDKGWQRLRARRMNLLAQLSTPQEFRNYFNEEMNQITTSLSRVTMILDKADLCWSYLDCGYGPFCLLDDPEFAKVFSELMRRIATMEEALNAYNQQLIECTVERTELK